MRRRVEIGLLIALALLLGYFGYGWYEQNYASNDAGVFTAGTVKFTPIAVENPALRTDLLDRLKKLEYEGPHRNIFSATAPPPPAPIAPPVQTQAPVSTAPPPPPPVTVPATFFGYVTDAGTGTRRAFFSEGDNVYVVGIGDVLLGRFRLLQIGNSSAELEETASGRRATVTMEEPGPSS
jgi:hypothetical protein